MSYIPIINLTSAVTGVLPISNGGTNSSSQLLPLIVSSGLQTAQTGDSTLCTKTSPTSGIYEVGGYIDMTAYTLGVVALQAAYNDDTGASKTVTIPITSLAGVVAASIGALGDFSSLTTTIKTDGSASIVVKVVNTT